MNPEFFRIDAPRMAERVALAMLAESENIAQGTSTAKAAFPDLEHIHSNQARRGENFALTPDLSTARSFLKHYHPGDLPLGEKIINLETRLLDKTSAFLGRHPE